MHTTACYAPGKCTPHLWSLAQVEFLPVENTQKLYFTMFTDSILPSVIPSAC